MAEKIMKDFEKYEELVESLYRAKLIKDIPVENFTTFRHKKYKGTSSGQVYDIDVSAEFKVAGTDFLVIVECKLLKRKVDVGIINELVGRIKDIGANKGIIVTAEGFQEGAIKVAKANRIACVIVKDLGWQPFIGDPGSYFYQTKKLSNYYQKETKSQLPEGVTNTLESFIPNYNSSRDFGTLTKDSFVRFSEYGYDIIDDGESNVIVNSNGLISFWTLCLISK